MRYITKKLNSDTSNCLKNLQRKAPTTVENATKSWKQLKNKQSILNALLDEQYWLCCYSEIRSDEHDWGYHIEHVENKSQNPAKTFDYFNLLASAISSDDLREIKDVFGGHAKGKKGIPNPVDMNKFISPLQSDCQKFFVYLSDGQVTPNPNLTVDEQEKAQYTIDILNLNSGELVTLREQLWKDLDEFLEKNIKDMSDINLWLEDELLPAIDINDKKRKLKSFFSLKCQFFDDLVEPILANYNNGELL